MKEEPKSVWTKSWKGPQWLYAWLVLVAATFVLAVMVSQFIPGPRKSFGDGAGEIFFDFTGSLIVATVCVGLWVFVRWLCHWRNFKRFLFGFACLVTLIALAYAEEDLRGKYDWDNYKHEWEAKGVKFDFDDFVPAPVPDDQNFAMSPVWIARIKYLWQKEPEKAKVWYGDRVNDDDVAKFSDLMPITPGALVGSYWADHLPPTPDQPGGWTLGRLADLKPWQSYYRNLEEKTPAAQISITPRPQSPAADVLLALSKFDPAIEQLRQDSQRPYSRFPVQYETEPPGDILLPHLAAVKQCSEVLQLRALAELQNGQTDKAFDDIKLILRLVNSIRTEPFIITHLVRMAMVQIAIQPIYEGLAEHQWTDAHLVGLDSELAKLNFPADYEFSVGLELAAHDKTFQWLEEKRSRCWALFDIYGESGQSFGRGWTPYHLAAAFYLAPKGWFYQADILLARQQRYWLSVVEDGKHPLVSPAKVPQASKAVKAMYKSHSHFYFLSQFFNFDLSNYARRTAFAQESVDLTRIAIALERCHLAVGGCPDSLDMLAPKYMPEIPADIINGQPLHYRLTSDGHFILYSVGWNEKNDGGIAYRGNTERGDWVWRYPQK